MTPIPNEPEFSCRAIQDHGAGNPFCTCMTLPTPSEATPPAKVPR